MFNRTSNFDKLLDKATNCLELDEDWQTIMQICDLIRQGDCPPKHALNSIKKKLQSTNPHTAMFALLVLESMVKNCGHLVQDELATPEFMDEMRVLVKQAKTEKISTKILELLQTWACAFGMNPKYNIIQETVTRMKNEGHKFPAIKESDAMFASTTAPKWVDSNVCHRCRVLFSVVNRKHHCRGCGNAFCSKCTSKSSNIPQYGIEKQVRVCEACYEIFNAPRSASPNVKHDVGSLPSEYLSSSLAQQTQLPKQKTAEELKEEEDMQLALALSESEAEAREKEKKRMTSEMMSNATWKSKTLPIVENDEDEEDPELARYLNRSYWEKKQAEEKTEKKILSPDHFSISPGGPPSAPTTPTHQLENGEVLENKINDFVLFLKSQVEIFVNRMKSNSSRGRSISNDSSVQTLFMKVTKNHSTLLNHIHQQDDSRVYYERLQDKLAQVKDAMMALDALREEHREKMRREAEEAERLRQLQMAQKLEIMRRRKQEYLQFQRQLAIQKVQEQEREMQMRQEQQKQHYLMGNVAMSQHIPWDPSIPMQAPPSQYGPQYQPIPGGYLPPGGYPMPGSAGPVPQPQQPMSLPPNMAQVLPHSGQMPLPQDQQPPRGPPQSLPPQAVQSRLIGPQPNPERPPIPNPAQMPQIHPSQIPPSTYQGMPLPVGNQMLPQSRSLVMAPPGARPSLPPPGAATNMGMPIPQVVGMKTTPRLPQNVGMPPMPGPGMGMPSGVVLPQQPVPISQGSQHGLPPVMGMPPGGVALKQSGSGLLNGQPNMMMPPGGPQGMPPMQQQPQPQPQPQPQMPPPQQAPNEQNESKTGELISFD